MEESKWAGGGTTATDYFHRNQIQETSARKGF